MNDTKKQIMTDLDRSYGIQKIMDLHAKKDYRDETLFLAANILDKYMISIGVENFKKEKMIHLATVCTLIGAKIEEPIAPCFKRMMLELTEIEQQYVTDKKDLIKLEGKVLAALGFNINFPGPIPALERYERILNYH